MDFRGTEPSRNVYCFYDQQKCAVREGEKVKKGERGGCGEELSIAAIGRWTPRAVRQEKGARGRGG